jgi:hypothetical protein
MPEGRDAAEGARLGDGNWPSCARIVRAGQNKRVEKGKKQRLSGAICTEKPLLRERRLGDLNPGWARTQTALAVPSLARRRLQANRA